VNLYLKSLSTYIPESPDEAPKLEYLSPLFRRRLTQLTRMTVEVVHDLLEKNPGFDKDNTKIIFSSFSGEIGQTYKVNQQFNEDKEIKPATFSLSVYNCPVAQATIAFGLTAGYVAIYPKEDDFFSALQAGAAPLLSGEEKEVLFVFADEKIGEAYKDVPLYGKSSQNKQPLAFAALLTTDKTDKEINLDHFKQGTPLSFIEELK